MNAPLTKNIFTRTETGWIPGDYCMGPFGGMHGGTVSGVLTGELELMARDAGHGIPISATSYLLRPAPASAFETKPTAVREGARVAVYENELWANGKLQAKASMCFLKALPGDTPLPDLPDGIRGTRLSDPACVPTSLPTWSFGRELTSELFLAGLDMRVGEDGCAWFKANTSLLDQPTPFATTMSLADFGTMVSVINTGVRPKLGGWPNADLSLHLSRMPEGDWIGVLPKSDWGTDGRGVTETEIHDLYGQIGRATQTAVLSPLPE